MIIGVDFDNTIIAYDKLFYGQARQRALIGATTPVDKTAVRDAVRRLHGDIAWQRLQGLVYGQLIGEAPPFEGVIDFFTACHEQGHKCCIVSHKTEYASYDPSHTNLRAAAISWLRDNLLNRPGIAMGANEIFFEATRAAKIKRIRALGCSHFIDDLPEVLADPNMPGELTGILFRRRTGSAQTSPIFDNWYKIKQWLFP